MKKTNVNRVFILGAYILAILAILIATRGEWVCIAKECVEEVSGEEWIARFCRPNEEQTDMNCDFAIGENEYSLPLSRLDSTTFKGCIKYKCAVNVYVKQNKEAKINENT